MLLQSLIQKWSFEFALFQMFCTVQWTKICIEGETDQTVKCILKFYWKRPDTMRIWDRCKILLRIFLCKARLNEAAINFVKLGCHIWSQQDLWWQMRVIIYLYIIYEVTLSRRSPNSEDFSFISVGTHNYEHMFQISKVSFPNFLELVSSCLTLRLLSKSWCSCREHPVVLL